MTTKNDLYWILNRMDVSNEQMELITKLRKLDKLKDTIIHSYTEISDLSKKNSKDGCEITLMTTVDPSLKTIDDLDSYLTKHRIPDYTKNIGTGMDQGEIIRLEYKLSPIHEVNVVFISENFK